MAKPIGTLGTIDTIAVYGRVFTDLTNLLALHGYVATSTRVYATLRKSSSTSGYQVTTGKTLTLSAGNLMCAIVSSTFGVSPAYGDNDVGLDSSSTPTNVVNFIGSSTAIAMSINTGAAATPSGAPVNSTAWLFQVPALKYPAMLASASGTAVTASFYGYEA